MHSNTQILTSPPHTHTHCQQSHWGQHLFGDKVTLLPRGLWTSTMKASHPAHTHPDDGWRGGVGGVSQHPATAVLNPYSGSPLRYPPFTPCTDGAKSPLVTQSHAVNRWSSHWVKDRAGRGGSPSIPAGNNGAAGQECRLQEEGVREEGGMLRHSRAMRALWNWEERRESIWDDGRRGGGVWLGSALGGGGLCVKVGQQCFRLTCKQEQKQTNKKRHCAHTFACSQESQLQFNAHFKDNSYGRLSLCTKTDNFTVDATLQWGYIHAY